MQKPVEINRIFGHLDRDPAAVAEVLARMPPEDAAQLLALARVWLGAVIDKYQEVTRDQGTL